MKYLIWAISIVFVLASCNSASTNDSKAKETKQATTAAKPAVQKTAQTTASKSKVNWVSLDEAQKMTKKTPKKMIVDVYTNWCGPCKMMDARTFTNDEVAKLMNDKFYAVKFNGESPDAVKFNGETFKNPGYKADIPKNRRNGRHQLVSKLGIRGYPSLVVIDENMKIVKSIVGFKTPEQLLPELNAL